MTSRKSWFLCFFMLSLPLSGCAGGRFGTMEGAERFPSQTLTDWVSYADQVSVVLVKDEQAMPQSDDPDVQAGYIGREVTLLIETTVWRREQAPDAGESIKIVAPGWREQSGRRVSVSVEGGPRVEVGHRYLAPLAFDDDGTWGLLSISSVLPVSQSEVDADARNTNADTPVVRKLSGRQLSEIASILAATSPDPVASRFFTLPPGERAQAVWDAKHPSEASTP